MNRLFKTLLLWLLAAVLPLHAVATTMSASCGPIHHQAMQSVLPHAGNHDDMAAEQHHEHEGASGVVHVAPDILSGPSSDDLQSAASHAHSTCSACSASCIGAIAPPSALNSPPHFNGAEIVNISFTPLATGFIPSGLERPPRHPFA